MLDPEHRPTIMDASRAADAGLEATPAGSELEADRGPSKAAGFAAHLVKPLEAAELVEVIERAALQSTEQAR